MSSPLRWSPLQVELKNHGQKGETRTKMWTECGGLQQGERKALEKVKEGVRAGTEVLEPDGGKGPRLEVRVLCRHLFEEMRNCTQYMTTLLQTPHYNDGKTKLKLNLCPWLTMSSWLRLGVNIRVWHSPDDKKQRSQATWGNSILFLYTPSLILKDEF